MEFASGFAYVNPKQQENIEEIEEIEMENQMEQDNIEVEAFDMQNQVILEEKEEQEDQEEQKIEKHSNQKSLAGRGRGRGSAMLNKKQTAPTMSRMAAPQKKQKQEIQQKQIPQKFKKIAQQGNVIRQAVDTNVMKVALNILKQESALATGDPILCNQCQSVLNSFSELQQIGQDQYN